MKNCTARTISEYVEFLNGNSTLCQEYFDNNMDKDLAEFIRENLHLIDNTHIPDMWEICKEIEHFAERNGGDKTLYIIPVERVGNLSVHNIDVGAQTCIISQDEIYYYTECLTANAHRRAELNGGWYNKETAFTIYGLKINGGIEKIW